MWVKDQAYLRDVRKHPCLICEVNGVDAHHLRGVSPQHRGFSMKASGDDWAVPLCRTHHMEAHRHGDESMFWIEHRVDPQVWAVRNYRKWNQKTTQ